MIRLKSPEEIEIMSEGGKRLAEVIQKLKFEVRVGMQTLELDKLAFGFITESGAEPLFLGYKPAGASKAYPFSLCVSMNDCVVHGQPSKYVIKAGDIVKLDLGLRYKKLCVDSAISVGVGKISKEAEKLIKITREALNRGISESLVGKTTGDIGEAVERFVKNNGFSVVKALVGHGIGDSLHEDPYVPNFGRRGDGEDLKPGMTIAIEPMVTTGSGEVKQLADDSFVSADGSLAGHFEHTLAITKEGPRIMTNI